MIDITKWLNISKTAHNTIEVMIDVVKASPWGEKLMASETIVNFI